MAKEDRNIQLGPGDGNPIPLDSIIFCPGCGSGLYIVVLPIYPTTIRNPANLESITEHKSEKYPFNCPECSRLIINSSGKFKFRPPRPPADL